MILASHGLIASSILQVDPDWLAYYNRVIADGGSLTTTEQNATKTLVADLKAAGIWSSMKAIYPMVGASAAACKQNLKSASFTGSFSTGWTFASTGVTPNGTSAYMDTFLAPNGNLSQDDAHATMYSRTNVFSGNGIDIGCGYTGSNADFYLSASYGGSGGITNINGSGFGGFATNTNTLGFFLSQRTSATNRDFYQNNTLISTSANISTTPTSVTINLGRNTVFEYSSREISFASFGASFDATQRGNFYTAVQAFQTTLSRQV
jgi:hypothetical protein